MPDDELSPREAADVLGVTVRTVQRWVADGRLPARRVGSRVRLSRSSLTSVADEARPAASVPRKRIRTLLVANRGEIAVRIARTARRLGIRPVGVHVDGERPHAGMDSVAVIPSYLDGDAIVAAARSLGADALHPGYGFLAEQPAFATAVVAAGLTWIGPPPDAIAAMGDKAAARRHAAAHGIPVVAGYDGVAQDGDTLAREAERIGYPILLKPSAGGGGKGMRIVTGAAELPGAIEAARRESRRAFADERLVLERYLTGARHVEIQVLFDAAGAGTHLGERDCSAQRRSQKIVEEAPGPAVDGALRARMGEAAVALAASVGYVGAGTVEMLLAADGSFAFLEMNTRLQVEHPVTEEVTGRDLVADQLRIAEGSTLADLGLSTAPELHGHAIEARIYAEDPEAGFLPATGRLALLRWPERARVETGIREGDTVDDRWDPMLAKIVVTGPTRDAALEALREALEATTVLGVRTNVRFLRQLTATEAMRRGEIRTDTIAAEGPPARAEPREEHWRAATRLLAHGRDDPWSGGWRLNGPPVHRVTGGDETRRVTLTADAPEPGPATVLDGDAVHVDVDGQSVSFRLAPPPTVADALRRASRAESGGGATLVAPMPGRVIGIRATVGDAVASGQPVVVIEAMKMEHAVTAPVDGTLVRLDVREGQQVGRGDVIGEVAQSAP